MDIIKYISQESLVLIPVLYILGLVIKSTPKIKDWLIPYILMVLGIVGSIALNGLNVQAIIQGILVAGSTVFANQLIKQTQNKDQ